ncbi:hypothetical protein ACFSJW_08545 [Flavobacterium artemisiae]
MKIQMKNFLWFTHTNIDCSARSDFSFDLTPYIEVFIKKELWRKKRYRTEYNFEFEKENLENLKSIKINFHIKASPYSNCHEYELILEKYFPLKKIERLKIISSGISDASRIAVIEAQFKSKKILRRNLKYLEEKNYEKVLDQLDNENHESWEESNKLKSIISEFIQFLTFNLHLNFLTHRYSFSFTDKPNPSGFSLINKNNNYFYETDRMEMLSHYIKYERETDELDSLMRKTSQFWTRDINSIHFFMEALKSNYITSNNFIKLVFTLETFFGQNVSNDYVSLVIPLIISDNISDMKKFREIIRKSFNLRNQIVHGNTLVDFNSSAKPYFNDIRNDELFFELKNVIINIFHFYIKKDLYLKKQNVHINHELIFQLLPKGIY